MKPLLRLCHRTAKGGFTTIEMIGVIAIMAIASAVIAPNLSRRISRTNGDSEEQTLAAIADGLIRYVQANQTIPGASSWHSNVATYTGLSASEALRVDPSDSASARVYLINPSFSPGTPSGNPVWSQTSTGAVSTANATVLIISTHKSSLTLPVSSGVAASQAAFDNIWNWTCGAATESPPPGWSSGWTGNGEFLHVQRVNLSSLFQLATFSNQHHPTNYPYYQVGGASATSMSTTNVLSAYYLGGSILRLYFTNGTTLQMSHTLGNGVNFVYESSRWRIS